MSQSSAITTYQAIGNREDLTDVISTITLHETPLFSTLGKTKAIAKLHEWQTDSLSTGSTNAAIEGADFSFSRPGARSRLTNNVQIFTKTVEVSGTQDAVSTAGLDSEFAYQMEKRMKEIATDVEIALITGTGNSGATGTARLLKGILPFITTNVETGTGTGSETLTETMYNDTLQTVWAAGGRPDTSYVNGFQKRKISSFSTANDRTTEIGADGKISNFVDVYQSDFGTQTITLDSFMTASVVAVIQKDLWKVAMLRGIRMVDVATIGDAKRGALVGSLTLEARNEAGNGKVTQLSTS